MVLRKLLSILTITLLFIVFSSCTDSSGDDVEFIPPETQESNSGSGSNGGNTFPTPPPSQTFPTPPPASFSNNPPCDTLAFGDGRGGDLWIPQSESNGLPVYILNNGWQDPATVDAVTFGGGTERANFTGFANPDAGRLRPHFRFSRGCGNYTGTLIVTDSSQVCEVRLPGSPCSRID